LLAFLEECKREIFWMVVGPVGVLVQQLIDVLTNVLVSGSQLLRRERSRNG
jgi:hypothetical protein